MVRHELKKVMHWHFLVLLTLLLIVQGFSVYMVDKFDYENPVDEIYDSYIEEVKGRLNTESEQYIINEWLLINKILRSASEMAELYTQGKIDRKEYAQFNDDYAYAQSHKNSIEKIMEDYRYIKVMLRRSNSRIKPEFMNYRYWNYYFDSGSLGWLPIIFIIILAVYSAYVENSSGMWNIINSSYNGKLKMVTVKLCSSALLGALTAFVFSAAEFLEYNIFFAMPSVEAHIQSIHIFHDIGFVLTIENMVIILIVWRTIIGGLIGGAVVLIALLVKNDIVSIAVSLFITFGSIFLLKFVPRLYPYSLGGMYNGVSTIVYEASSNNAVILGAWFVLVVFIALLFVLNMRRLGYRLKKAVY